MHDGELERLAELARAAAEHAYVPASGFHVGVALVAKDGRVFTGCNVENASYGLTICAERNAVFHAVAEGARDFSLCVIYTPLEEPGSPCGACCQVLAEFGKDMRIVLAGKTGISKRMNLGDFLPRPFER